MASSGSITRKLTLAQLAQPGGMRRPPLPPSIRDIAARRDQATERVPSAERSTMHMPTLPGPQMHVARVRDGVRAQTALTCELAPPNFPREAMLDMSINAYARAEKGEKPGHIYLHWLHVLDHMAATGGATYQGIPLHVKRGMAFWSCICTRYTLAEEPE